MMREMWEAWNEVPEAPERLRFSRRSHYRGVPISAAEIPWDRGATVELRNGEFYLLSLGRPLVSAVPHFEQHPDAADEELRRL